MSEDETWTCLVISSVNEWQPSHTSPLLIVCLSLFHNLFYSHYKQSGPFSLSLHHRSFASANSLVVLRCFLAVCRSVAWRGLWTLPLLGFSFILAVRYRSDLWPLSISSHHGLWLLNQGTNTPGQVSTRIFCELTMTDMEDVPASRVQCLS